MSKAKRKKTSEPTIDKSQHIEQRDKIKDTFAIKEFPWTEKQQKLIDVALNKHTSIIFIKSPAGTGKTLVSLFCCLELLRDKKISDIKYIRAAIECGKSIGYIPGDRNEKLEPYGMPAFDHFNELLHKSTIDTLVKDKRVEVETIGFLQGRTFHTTGIIADECGDLNLTQLRLLMTRLGKFSKMFIIGDIKQVNIKDSGFDTVYNMFNNEKSKEQGIHTFEFTREDCKRNKITQFILEQFEQPNPMFPDK